MEKTTHVSFNMVSADGNKVTDATQATGLQAAFSDGSSKVINIGELPQSVQVQAMFAGFKQRCAIASKPRDKDQRTLENTKERVDMLIDKLTAGVWEIRVQGEGAGRRNMLAEAIEAALKDAGEEVNDERRKSILAKITGEDRAKTAELRRGVLANPVIKAQYDRLQAEAQAARAAASAKEAEGVELTGF